MADDHGEGGNPWAELLFLCVALFVLIVFWFVSGRPNASSLGDLFVKSPIATSTIGAGTSTPSWLPFWNPKTAGNQTWQVQPQYQYNNTLGSVPVSAQLSRYVPSPLGGEIIIQDYGGVRSSVPNQEYIVLYANSANPEPINLSGWQLRSPMTGRGAVIGGAVEIPILGVAPTLGPVMLSPGDVVVITTGRSPVGASFRESMCSGYFSHFQYFTPPFAQGCPLPQNELNYYSDPVDAQDLQCRQTVAQLQPCQVVISAPPGVTSSCSDFITQRFTYNGCVAAHRNDQNFLGARWRVYLGQSGELWDNTSDVVALLDATGRLVTAASY